AIIVMGSYAGFQGSTGQTAYAASKAGLMGLVRSAAREWGEHNIRVNLVLPGWHQTAMTEPVAADAHTRQTHLLGRAPRLSSVVATVYRLACNLDTSGQVWNVDSRIL
ncbi:MAG: SDR family oxidoreductase, partial [Nitrospirae bacterium]|nr:SDR family oxidoreductase [Nitrospirota bacterium]